MIPLELEKIEKRVKLETELKEYKGDDRIVWAEDKRLEIEEAGNKLMKVKVEPNTQFVELYYYPESYRLGKAVGILALAVLSYFALDCLTPRRQRI